MTGAQKFSLVYLISLECHKKEYKNKVFCNDTCDVLCNWMITCFIHLLINTTSELIYVIKSKSKILDSLNMQFVITWFGLIEKV